MGDGKENKNQGPVSMPASPRTSVTKRRAKCPSDDVAQA